MYPKEYIGYFQMNKESILIINFSVSKIGLSTTFQSLWEQKEAGRLGPIVDVEY
jgi:hypothetical protein